MRQDVTSQGDVVIIEERCTRCGRTQVVEERPAPIGQHHV
jgi:tRNA 2-selenouridine synthase SelU